MVVSGKQKGRSKDSLAREAEPVAALAAFPAEPQEPLDNLPKTVDVADSEMNHVTQNDKDEQPMDTREGEYCNLWQHPS